MTNAQRNQLKKALETLKASLKKKLPRAVEPTRHDEATAGIDEDEQPLAEMEQAIASNRNRNDALMMAKVDAALLRLKTDPDDFGNCRDCGDEILFARLKAMPYVELCVECQGKLDGGPKVRQTRRSLTDYVD